MPPYLPEMDKMFQGWAVDGSTSFVPGFSNPIRVQSSDEEAPGEEDDQVTPVTNTTPISRSSKRGSSSSSTARSPSKRMRSPAVRAMDSNMRRHNEISQQKVVLMQQALEEAKGAEKRRLELNEQKVEKVIQLAAELGVTPTTNPELYSGVVQIVQKQNVMNLFLNPNTTPEGRMIAMQLLSEEEEVEDSVSTQESTMNGAWLQMMAQLMDDDDDAMFYCMYEYAIHVDKYLNRGQYRQPAMTGLEWVQRKLGDMNSCYNMFRMSPSMFHRLHDVLVESYGLKNTRKSISIEALGMFLWILGAPQPTRQAEDRFERSLATVSYMFNKVLECVVKLAADIIKPMDPEFRTMHPRLQNRRFYPYFKDCIGAIDGTHVPCVVPASNFMQHLCCKGITTQNVLAVCDFDMRFTFILAGWPGSAHNMRVFNDATTTYSQVFPHPPQGKYYLVDSGYANRIGYLAPYKGTKYHLQECRHAPEPEGMKEIFNYTHSSLRNVVERAFGVLKMKWKILQHVPSYAPHKQSQIITACCALHNFIRTSGIHDSHFGRCDRDENYVPREAFENQPDAEEVEDECDDMNAIRDAIALSLENRAE